MTLSKENMWTLVRFRPELTQLFITTLLTRQ